MQHVYWSFKFLSMWYVDNSVNNHGQLLALWFMAVNWYVTASNVEKIAYIKYMNQVWDIMAIFVPNLEKNKNHCDTHWDVIRTVYLWPTFMILLTFALAFGVQPLR